MAAPAVPGPVADDTPAHRAVSATPTAAAAAGPLPGELLDTRTAMTRTLLGATPTG
ncbi:hypothetical protein [Modestobacter sp. SYSU DS0290]